MRSSKEDRFVYSGSSMRGTLNPGDLLRVDVCGLDELVPGDVAAFKLNGSQCLAVHRIRAVRPEGLVAQGDNCPHPDSRRITEKELIGKVTRLRRGEKTIRIAGGNRGLRRAKAIGILRQLRTMLSPVLRPVYRRIGCAIVAVMRWDPPILRIRVKTSSGPITKFVHSGRTVARWKAATGEWFCAKPYDLILRKPAQ